MCYVLHSGHCHACSVCPRPDRIEGYRHALSLSRAAWKVTRIRYTSSIRWTHPSGLHLQSRRLKQYRLASRDVNRACLQFRRSFPDQLVKAVTAYREEGGNVASTELPSTFHFTRLPSDLTDTCVHSSTSMQRYGQDQGAFTRLRRHDHAVRWRDGDDHRGSACRRIAGARGDTSCICFFLVSYLILYHFV